MFDAPPPAGADQTIVVVGHPLPDPASDASLDIEVIKRKALADGPRVRLDRLLTAIPGVQGFRRSASDSSHPTSQGITLRALGGNAASRALLILDGVPQADPFGGWVNWPAYDPSGLEEVRIIKGGGSVGHGPGALAGVIDMRSFAGKQARASIDAGSRSSWDGRFYAGLATGGGLLTLNGQAGASSGFVPITAATRGPADRRAPYREGNIHARYIAPAGADRELQLSLLGFFDDRERGQAFTDNRSKGLDGSLRLVGSGSLQWSALAYAQSRRFVSSFASVDDDRIASSRVSLQRVPSTSVGGGIEVRPQLGALELRAGADVRLASGESNELLAYQAGRPTRARTAGGRSGTEGLFAETLLKSGRLTLSGGARIDHWRLWSGELLEYPLGGGAPTRNEHYPGRDGWRPTACAGATLRLDPQTLLRSAVYQGWRLPTLNELYRPFRAGRDATAANPFLDPETLVGAEAGIDHNSAMLDLSLTAFASQLSDAVANVTLGHGPGTFPGVGFVSGAYRQRQNIAAIRTRGVETSAAVRWRRWEAKLAASLVQAKVASGPPAQQLDGLRPAQTPNFWLSAGIGWKDGDRVAQLSVRHSGAQFDDDLNKRRLRAATTFDAFAAWPLSRRLNLTFTATNLFDKMVAAAVSDDGIVERATPRTVMFGVRFD